MPSPKEARRDPRIPPFLKPCRQGSLIYNDETVTGVKKANNQLAAAAKAWDPKPFSANGK